MGVHPVAHDVGNVGDLLPHDEPQPRPGQGAQVPIRQHARVGDHGHLGELMGGLEGLDRRDDRGGLGAIALKRFNHQREPARVGQQADGDLRLQAAFLAVMPTSA